VSFVITDNENELGDNIHRLLARPLPRRPGRRRDGVLASDGKFRADSVLAKHDERYMPRDSRRR